MAESWVAVYRTTNAGEVHFLLSLLESKEIDAVPVNKQDSMHVHLNNQVPIEIHVKSKDVIRSKYLIEKELKNE